MFRLDLQIQIFWAIALLAARPCALLCYITSFFSRKALPSSALDQDSMLCSEVTIKITAKITKLHQNALQCYVNIPLSFQNKVWHTAHRLKRFGRGRKRERDVKSYSHWKHQSNGRSVYLLPLVPYALAASFVQLQHNDQGYTNIIGCL